MKLLTLKLENFMGAKIYEVAPNGADLAIYGDNGTGKSTIATAYTWLLLGKDIRGAADFSLKTLDEQNQPVHNLEHSAEAAFELAGGMKLTLKKTFAEVYKRTRGSAVSEFSGHETRYWLNGVPVQEQEYQARLSALAPAAILHTLTDPVHFLTRLPWKERRNLLLQVCGDVSDEDVIRLSPKLKGLPEVMQGRTLDETRKILGATRKELNAELERLPVRIDEARRSKVDVPHGDHDAELARVKADLERLRDEKSRLSAGGAVAAQTKNLHELEAEMARVKTRIIGAGNPERDTALSEQSRLTREIADLEAKLAMLESRLNVAAEDCERLEAECAALRQEYTARMGEQHEGEGVCPACGQSLPEDQLERAAAKANERKAADLAAINEKGKAKKARLEALRAQALTWSNEQNDLAERLESLQSSLVALVVPEATSASPERDSEWQLLAEKKAEVVKLIDQLGADSGSARAALEQKMLACEAAINQLGAYISQTARNAELDKRIAQLSQQEKDLAAKFEQAEADLWLCDEFTRQKVSLLTERINSRFELCRFRLFEQQINGGLAECCDVYWACTGAPPSHGQEIRCGIELIDVLGRHFGLTPPVVIDNAEAVTCYLRTAAQQLRFYVSESDRALRVQFGSTPTLQVATPATTGSEEPQEALAF